MALNVYTQQPVMTRAELRTELELLLTAGIRAGPTGEPSASEIRKASNQVARVLQLLDRYLAGRGVAG